MHLPEHVETVRTTFPTTFTWDYAHRDAQLARLYTNAKRDQWDGATALDWSLNVEPEAENLPDSEIAIYGSDQPPPADAARSDPRRLAAGEVRGARHPPVRGPRCLRRRRPEAEPAIATVQ